MGETSADRHCDLGCLFTVSAACETNPKQNFTFHVGMSKILVLQYKAIAKIKWCKWFIAMLTFQCFILFQMFIVFECFYGFSFS